MINWTNHLSALGQQKVFEIWRCLKIWCIGVSQVVDKLDKKLDNNDVPLGFWDTLFSDTAEILQTLKLEPSTQPEP